MGDVELAPRLSRQGVYFVYSPLYHQPFRCLLRLDAASASTHVGHTRHATDTKMVAFAFDIIYIIFNVRRQ